MLLRGRAAAVQPRLDELGPHFQALLAGDPTADLTAVALELGRDADAKVDVDRGLDRIARLARRVKGRIGSFPEPWIVLEAMNTVLFREEGFRGNTADYYDPRNSYLDQVLERRVGIPLSLSVLYLAIAERVSLPLAGVNLPAHFVVRTAASDEGTFIDPYHGGCLLDAAGCESLVSNVMQKPVRLTPDQLRPCSSAAIVQRMLQNLKTIYLRKRRIHDAIPVLKRLVLLRPDHPEDLRDLGIACFYGDLRGEALGYLEAYLKVAPLAEDAREIRLLLNSARIH
jgi:regulator of sirC expression with transglutaminase-like and TPR domain